MADNEVLNILKQGVEVWNAWRAKHPQTFVDLKGADLKDTILFGYNLSGVECSYANLGRSVLRYADLSFANLTEANLARADLTYTNLQRARLKRANFDRAQMGWTTIVESDLSETLGLDTVIHSGPSSIGIDTVYESKGSIPETFLRGAGLPDNFITYMGSLTGKAFEFYSCFISYSSRDNIFAERLHADLQDNAVRCWFAPEDLKIGEKIRPSIDESIKKHDKLLLILSEDSVASEWVEQEVETALARERHEKRTVLFPIRVDDTVMQSDAGWPAFIRNTRNIGDFRNWKNHDIYRKALERLLRDLKA